MLEILVEHTRDSSSIIRDGAITALGDFDDPQAVPAVLRALLDRNADVVRAAFTALKKIGDRRVVRPLLRFGHERPEWRPLANDTLVRLGPRVVQELLNILQTNDAGLTLDAIVVLGRIGDKQAVSALIACMNHVSNLLRAHVTEALAADRRLTRGAAVAASVGRPVHTDSRERGGWSGAWPTRVRCVRC